MTFTQTAKNELLNNNKNLSPCCKTVFLGCLIRTIGNIEINFNGFGFSLASENLNLLKFAASLTEKSFGASCRIVGEEGGRLKNRTLYRLLCDKSESVLFECGVLSVDSEGLRQINPAFDQSMLVDECCKKAFVVAMFLGCGSVTLKDGYHCEFDVNESSLAAQLVSVLEGFMFSPKVSKRKYGSVVYFKGSDEISDLLVLMGVNKALFTLQDTIVERSFRNRANRQTNCISANIGKVVDASEKQLAAIRLIEEKSGLNSLPEKLLKTALLRKQNPSASLDELVALSDECVSKSGLNHRFRKILEIANDLKGGQNEDC